jgi:hypothetical protein
MLNLGIRNYPQYTDVKRRPSNMPQSRLTQKTFFPQMTTGSADAQFSNIVLSCMASSTRYLYIIAVRWTKRDSHAKFLLVQIVQYVALSYSSVHHVENVCIRMSKHDLQ